MIDIIQERREVKLPSGATLRIQVAPFALAKKLYQVVLNELKLVQIPDNLKETLSVGSLIKDFFCVGFGSEAIDKVLWECFASCTYDMGDGEKRVTPDTFEPVKAREDYMEACVEVAKDNVGPFVKSLYADWQRAIVLVESLGVSQK